MTLERARELILLQINLGSGYNRNAVTIILGEVGRNHGQAAVDKLIDEMRLEQVFGLQKGREYH